MNAQVSCFDVNNKTTKLLPHDLFNLPSRYILEKKKKNQHFAKTRKYEQGLPLFRPPSKNIQAKQINNKQ